MVSPMVCGICALYVSGSSTAQLRQHVGLGRKFARPGSKKGHSQSQGIRLVLRRAPSLGDTYRSWQGTWLERRQCDGGSGKEHSGLWDIYHQCPLFCLTTCGQVLTILCGERHEQTAAWLTWLSIFSSTREVFWGRASTRRRIPAPEMKLDSTFRVFSTLFTFSISARALMAREKQDLMNYLG